MKYRTQLLITLFTGMLLLNSCYPGGPDEIEEYDAQLPGADPKRYCTGI